MKQWNIGNTTVRNPERIKAGLQLLSREFLGKTFDENQQLAYFESLKKLGLLQSDTTDDATKRHSARKWAAAYNQLGLAVALKSEPPIRITEAGEDLLNDEILDSDVFLRQLLKIQIPSPRERLGHDINAVHPFYVVLKVCRGLNKKNLRGPTKEEIAIFIQTTIENSSIETTIEEITDYRSRRGSIGGLVKKRRFFRDTAMERLARLNADLIDTRYELLDRIIDHFNETGKFDQSALEELTSTGKGSATKDAATARLKIMQSTRAGKPETARSHVSELLLGKKANTLVDYADTTTRYSKMSGLFTISGDKFVIKDSSLNLVDAILESYTPQILEDENFISAFEGSSYPVLPIDDIEFASKDIQELAKYADSIGVVKDKIERLIDDANPRALRVSKDKLENELIEAKELIFYKKQSTEIAVSDIRDIFEKINNREIIAGSSYMPAWAEWAVWRVLLSINTISSPISETRNFKIDTELNPIHHAKSGVADMVFEYENEYIIPTEVTLSRDERQYNMEGVPVKHHVKNIIEKNTDATVVSLFTAPVIHPATAHEFYTASIYSTKLNKPLSLNIIPVTFSQLLSLLPGAKNGCSDGEQLIRKLEELKDLKSSVSTGPEWLKGIAVAMGC